MGLDFRFKRWKMSSKTLNRHKLTSISVYVRATGRRVRTRRTNKNRIAYIYIYIYIRKWTRPLAYKISTQKDVSPFRSATRWRFYNADGVSNARKEKNQNKQIGYTEITFGVGHLRGRRGKFMRKQRARNVKKSVSPKKRKSRPTAGCTERSHLGVKSRSGDRNRI